MAHQGVVICKLYVSHTAQIIFFHLLLIVILFVLLLLLLLLLLVCHDARAASPSAKARSERFEYVYTLPSIHC
jgi:uncharacterized protein (DUF58 family)